MNAESGKMFSKMRPLRPLPQRGDNESGERDGKGSVGRENFIGMGYTDTILTFKHHPKI